MTAKKKKERKTERKNEILRMLGRVNTSSNEAGTLHAVTATIARPHMMLAATDYFECSCGVAAGEGGCPRLR
jgi:hypothetical protein